MILTLSVITCQGKRDFNVLYPVSCLELSKIICIIIFGKDSNVYVRLNLVALVFSLKDKKLLH